MGIWQTCKIGLQLPKKEAVFQLNRVKTMHFLCYIFLLHVLIALPNGIRLIKASFSRGEFGKESLLILFIYPLFIVLFGLLGISILASIGLFLRRIAKRKLVYQLLWKMTVYALTYPVLLYVIFDVLHYTSWLTNLILFSVFLVIFTRMILVYPKIRKKSRLPRT
ncbi:MAG TPA: DUF1189 family protein [Virgibacillus sp.]|nr:DUF1189 family protein [Virgibacillus sp.]